MPPARDWACHAPLLSSQPPPARDGQTVHAGDVLAVLISPDLQAKHAGAIADEALLKWEVDQQSFDERLQQQGAALARLVLDGKACQGKGIRFVAATLQREVGF